MISTRLPVRTRVCSNTGSVGLQAIKVKVTIFELIAVIIIIYRMLIRTAKAFFRYQCSNRYNFSRRARTAQVILHSTQQIENLIIRKEAKEQGKETLLRPWKTLASAQDKFRVALVGLPNSGKSSLFNCLVGERVAVVDK